MLFLAPADLRALDASSLDALLERSELTVAFGEGDVRGIAAAALLFADYAVLREHATLHLDTSEAWAGAVWRLGSRVLHLAEVSNARVAHESGLCDEVAAGEPGPWREEWMQHRSVLALDTAAALIRARGSDRLERAEFARLFAIGEPQKGLAAFLTKTRPTYS